MVLIGPDGGVVCVQATCQGKIYACGDCTDNDGDGKTDMNDVGCLGPCDNTETDLTLGIPGGNNAPCKADCYFDQDTGSGNDTCEWDHSCDPHETAPNYYPERSGPNRIALRPACPAISRAAASGVSTGLVTPRLRTVVA